MLVCYSRGKLRPHSPERRARSLVLAFMYCSACIVLLVAVSGASPEEVTAKMPPEEYNRRDRPVTTEDMLILWRANELLPSEAKWNHDHKNRICYRRQETFSLFCALEIASTQIIGKYEHRRVAIQEVRFAIRDVTGVEKWSHELRDYNNLPTTHFEDIKKVLKIASDRVSARLKP
jgi:hypothetical protein